MSDHTGIAWTDATWDPVTDVRVESVAVVPTEHVPCPPELYPAHSSSVVREGDHWRCLTCQPEAPR